ncbi:MAG: hypothetical protein ACOC6P_03335 [Candidatus Aminicenantaceae bacterium]
MKGRLFIISLMILFLSCTLNSDQLRTLSGNIQYKGNQTGPVQIRLYKLNVSSQGKVVSLSKRDIYGAKNPFREITLKHPSVYEFSQLPSGYYSIIAYMDLDKDLQLDFKPVEPMGWYASQPGARYSPVNLTKENKSNINCLLRCPTPFPEEDIQTEHGALKWIKGLPVLQLQGTVEERGYAHGYLLARQIIDFFEFYVIEDIWRSAKKYSDIFVPFLQTHISLPLEYEKESQALIQGMKDSGIDMEVESLGRDFNQTDLLAVNAYVERRAAFPVSPSSFCTQFAFWGDFTQNSKLLGGLVAARNMDGECDVRKVTVSHFLIFAVKPSETGHKQWISFMWPGFIGTISGINEEGLYSMENAGGTGPGPVVGNITPCSWIQRDILEQGVKTNTPDEILKEMSQFQCKGGGITAPGSIILWAFPFKGQKNAAFVYEGDRFGGKMRCPEEVRPVHSHNIMASNHHKVYGFDPEEPYFSFSRGVSFSSLWRYEAGMNELEALARQKKPLGIPEAKRLLQIVSHGSTEYSVIFSANQMRLWVAVDDLKTNMWDAPYLEWKEYEFDQLFK